MSTTTGHPEDMALPADRGELERAWIGEKFTMFPSGLVREGDLPERTWVRLWRRFGDPPPAATMRLYRGAPRARRKGMSWTRSQAVAWRYAALDPEGQVWEATVQPEHVLATLAQEVVVDPRGLGRLTEVVDPEPRQERSRSRREQQEDRARAVISARTDRRRLERDFSDGLRARRGNGRGLLANAVAARREADRKARRRRY